MADFLNHWARSLALCLLCYGVAGAAPVALFDGTSLAGWEGGTGWRVESGAITGGSMEGNPRNDFLATRAQFRNFRLTLEYRLNGSAGFVNGGVQFRSQRLRDPAHEMIGYQADIGAGYSGCLYDESRRKKMLAVAEPGLMDRLEKPGDWNQLEIRAVNERIQIFVNGTRTVNFTESQPEFAVGGRIGLQIHGDCKAVIAFRNLWLEEIAEVSPTESSEVLNRFGDFPAQPPGPAFRDGKFEPVPHEVVVFAGQTNLVAAQQDGQMEAALLGALPAFGLRLRSMAWEGDSVYQQWRDLNFGSWKDQLAAVGAGTVVAQFGQLESFDGTARIPEFIAAYHRLLDQFLQQTPRLILLSPIPWEKPVASHAPDLRQRQEELSAYVEAVRTVAKQRGAIFVDLFTPLLARPEGSPRLTWDGQRLNGEGHREIARLVTEVLAGRAPDPQSQEVALRAQIQEKNRLWADCWRPANWSFVYGDRIPQPYGKAGGSAPSLKATLELYKPRIAEMDARIAALAAGKPAPASVFADPPPPTPTAGAITPEEQLAHLEPAAGFGVELFASEAMGVVKPVQISWDERGRCYVACSPTYPQPIPGKAGEDYILVLEDTDHDGKADRQTRFAEGLTMVQGVEPGGGGVYVCDFDSLLHFRDTDGDGKADVRQVVFSGFGIGDTHQLINSISHGPDGSVWFSQGLHAFSRVETLHGSAQLDRSGLWRYQPRTGKLESFFNGAKAGHNCWGVAFDDGLRMFHKSGDRPAGYFSTPGLIVMTDPEEYHAVGALFDTNPKTTSLEFAGTAALPAELQGCALIAGYFGGVVEAHRLVEDGSGFRSVQLPRLLTSRDSSFRPVDVSVGPDGAIYLCDWFNPAIGHYQHSYADPARDRGHGRIWRLYSKNQPPVRPPTLHGLKPAQLIPHLQHPERWVRYQAKRLLFDQPTAEVLAAADAIAPVLQKAAEPSPRPPAGPAGTEVGAEANAAKSLSRALMELCGLYEAHQAPRLALLQFLAKSPDPVVRGSAARTAGSWSAQEASGCRDILTKLANDPSAGVRLEAVVACARLDRADAVLTALQVLDYPMDRFLDYALRQMVRASEPRWQPHLAAWQAQRTNSPAALGYLQKLAGAPREPDPPGKVIYDTLCLSCHQPEGKGLPGLYPPLADSDWVSGSPERLVKVLLHGLAGPISVGGEAFVQASPVPMPPMGLSDQQTADVLQYLRTHFGNQGDPIPVEFIRKMRETHGNRTTPWTAADLSP